MWEIERFVLNAEDLAKRSVNKLVSLPRFVMGRVDRFRDISSIERALATMLLGSIATTVATLTLIGNDDATRGAFLAGYLFTSVGSLIVLASGPNRR